MSTQPHRVMVVDDDRDIRESLCELLQYEGYDVVASANGQEALDWLRSHDAPCVILLDLMMPVMDGWTFCQVRKTDPALLQIPVVVITASGQDRTGGLDAMRVLQKPLPLEQVLGVVSEYC